MSYKSKTLLIAAVLLIGIAALLPFGNIHVAQAQTNELSCPVGSTALPAGVIINPATNRVRQLLCMDASGNISLPSQSALTPPVTINGNGTNLISVTDSGHGNAIIFGVSTGNGILVLGQQPGFHINSGGGANGDAWGKLTCSGSTITKTFSSGFTSVPVVEVFDETTKGGANLTAISNAAFTVSCTGATDALDYVVFGNPN